MSTQAIASEPQGKAGNATTQFGSLESVSPAAESANHNARKSRRQAGRLASISRDGRVAAFRRPSGVELCGLEKDTRTLIGARVGAQNDPFDHRGNGDYCGNGDRLGRREPGAAVDSESTEAAVDFGFAPGGFWLLANQLVHWMTEDGRSLHETVVGSRQSLRSSRGVLPSCILSGPDSSPNRSSRSAAETASGAGPDLDIVELYDGQLFAFPLLLGSREDESVFPIGPRLVCVIDREVIRLAHLERGTIFRTALPTGSSVVQVSPVFAGKGLVVVLGGRTREVWLLDVRGTRVLTVPCPRPDQVAIAEQRGRVVVGTGRTLCSIDLRDPKSVEWAETPFVIHNIDIDAAGKNLVFANGWARTRCWHTRYNAVFSERNL